MTNFALPAVQLSITLGEGLGLLILISRQGVSLPMRKVSALRRLTPMKRSLMEKLLDVQETLLEPIELDDEELAAVAGGGGITNVSNSLNNDTNSFNNSFNG